MKIVKKIIASTLILTILLLNGGSAYAFEIPTPPPAPTAPPIPTNPPSPTSAPTPPPEPTAPPGPWNPTPTPTPTPSSANNTPTPTSTPVAQVASGSTPTPTPASSSATPTPTASSTGGQDASGTSDPSITTGDATNSGLVSTNANSNLSATVNDGNNPGSLAVINNENGSGSTNSGSVQIGSDNTILQDNSATVLNNLDQESLTGENSTSRNVGSSQITTGDANTSGTVITSVNTNVDGVMVAEFNVVEDHMGDLILDFADSCVAGCGTNNMAVQNTGNGTNSANTAAIDSTTNNNTFQNNDATVENNMTLIANSGDNQADRNTGGDSVIDTGDANVSANVLTFANNNLAGNVVYAVVNIFGDLIGDILLPQGSLSACCLSSSTVANSGNGSGSTNQADLSQTNTDSTYQFNNVVLENNLVFDANSGNNSTTDNTNGDSSIVTGDTSIDAQVLNIANNNIAGGDWWLVLVNQAGQWLGKIVGADGANYAGSEGFDFIVNEFGEMMVVNSRNGQGSTNSGTVTQDTTNNLVQTNNANIVNNLNLSANTGGNSASRNTGGDSKIETGDAKIVANLVNFVNNNISGAGRLFVTVINVFGSWTGDFFGPGQEKADAVESPGIGGAGEIASNQNSGNVFAQESTASNVSQTGVANNQTNTVPRPTTTHSTSAVAGIRVFNPFRSDLADQNNVFTDSKKTVNVNLAWMLVILFPLGVITMIYRRWAK